MNFIETFLELFLKYYSKDTYQEFCSTFETHSGNPFSYSIFKGIDKSSVVKDKPESKMITGYAVKNDSPDSVTVDFGLDTHKLLRSFAQAFTFFKETTNHAIPLGDFRKSYEYFVPVYNSSRYFLFHGDGNCVSRALLFQAFLDTQMQIDSSVYYTRTLSNNFSHAYVLVNTDKEGLIHADIDLRHFYPESDVGQWKCDTLVSHFATVVGYLHYAKLLKEEKQWLFSELTMNDFDMLVDSIERTPEYYRYDKNASSNMISSRYSASLKEINQEITMSSDFQWKEDWKTGYRKLFKSDERRYFSRDLSCFIPLVLPPNGNLFIGLPSEDFPEELYDLMLIFQGRVPLFVNFEVDGFCSLALPELPWMLYTKRNSQLVLNGKKCALQKSGEFYVLGMKHLFSLIEVSQPIKLELEIPENCTFVLPFNAWVLNSAYFKSSTNADEVYFIESLE